MPFKDIATADSVYLEELPAADDKNARTALRRMQEVRFTACFFPCSLNILFETFVVFVPLAVRW